MAVIEADDDVARRDGSSPERGRGLLRPGVVVSVATLAVVILMQVALPYRHSLPPLRASLQGGAGVEAATTMPTEETTTTTAATFDPAAVQDLAGLGTVPADFVAVPDELDPNGVLTVDKVASGSPDPAALQARLTRLGFRTGYARGWITRDRQRVINVRVECFGSPDGAKSYAASTLLGARIQGAREFPTPFKDGYGWTVDEPSAAGKAPFHDAVVLLRSGDYLVRVTLASRAATPSPADAVSLANDPARRLGLS